MKEKKCTTSHILPQFWTFWFCCTYLMMWLAELKLSGYYIIVIHIALNMQATANCTDYSTSTKSLRTDISKVSEVNLYKMTIPAFLSFF